ncbi:MAG: PIN domain-containing protein [Pseudanabaenaceae cyanobacterium]|jgi:predicted nucleic acid-binding protein
MIRVVVDTNILVSAVLKGKVAESVILLLVSNPDFEWVVSEEILMEYRSVVMWIWWLSLIARLVCGL